MSGTYDNNTAGVDGGAIYISTGTEGILTGTVTFTNNKALAGNGGAIYVDGSGKITNNSSSVTFTNNTASWPDPAPAEAAYATTGAEVNKTASQSNIFLKKNMFPAIKGKKISTL